MKFDNQNQELAHKKVKDNVYNALHCTFSKDVDLVGDYLIMYLIHIEIKELHTKHIDEPFKITHDLKRTTERQP